MTVAAPDTWTRLRQCPICGKRDCKKSADDAILLCRRVGSGSFKTVNGGYLHRLLESERPRPHQYRGYRVRSIPALAPAIKFASRMAEYQHATHPQLLEDFAAHIGLTAGSLMSLGIGRAFDGGHDAFDAGNSALGGAGWALPMFDGALNIIGIKIRFSSGEKKSIRGSHEGLFLPSDQDHHGQLLICEGATDAAAATDMGFGNIIGRPSASGGMPYLIEYVELHNPANVVIVADNDESGQRGASNLASVLALHIPSIRIIGPPHGVKDLREWKIKGASKNDIQQAIDTAHIRRIHIAGVTANA